jgi:hypothetical protein
MEEEIAHCIKHKSEDRSVEKSKGVENSQEKGEQETRWKKRAEKRKYGERDEKTKWNSCSKRREKTSSKRRPSHFFNI